MKPNIRTRTLLAALGSTIIAASTARAADGTWVVDADGNWNTATNWLDEIIADGSGNAALFTAELTEARTITLGEDRTIGNITFTDGTTSSHNLSISGSDILSLAGTTPTIRVTQANRNLTISSRVAGSDGLAKRGLGTLTLGGAAALTFTGGITLREGTLALDYFSLASNLIASQDVTLSGGKLALSGNFLGTTQSLGNITATAGGGSILIDPNDDTTTLSLGSITTTAAGSSLLLGQTAGSFGTAALTTTSGTLANGIYGGKIVHLDGTTYNWATTATADPGPYILSGFTSYTTLPTSGLDPDTNYSVSAATTLTADQGAVPVNSLKWTTGNIALAGNNLVVESGGILMTGNANMALTSGTLTAGAASGYNLTFHTHTTNTTSATAGPSTFSMPINNNAGNPVSVTKTGPGLMRIRNVQNHTGGTYINEGIWVTDDGSASLGKGALHLNGGTLWIYSSNSNNNNFANQITSTTIGGDFEIRFNRANAGAATLGPTLSIGDHTLTVRGGGSVNNTGNAQLTITGATTLTGAATFNVQDQTAGTSTGTRLILNAVSNSGHLLTFNGNNTKSFTTINGIVSGTGGLTITGDGTLTLNGANTYTGDTLITAGKLIVNGDSSDATGTVSVNGTGTLGGSGTLGGNVSVAAAANLAPGTSVGTLSIGGDLDISAPAGGEGKLIYELDTIAASDAIAVTGTLNIGTDALGLSDFDLTNLGGLQNGHYTLISSGSLNGSLDPADVDGSLDGAKIQLQTNGGNIVLAVSELTGSTPFETWAGSGVLFDGDENGDGVSNGMAFLLGASDPNVIALGKLPTVTESAGGLILTFQMLDSIARGSASLTLEYSTTLATGSWTTVAVPDTDNTVDDVIFTITGTGPLDVTATIPASKAPDGKIFARLEAQETQEAQEIP